MRHNIQFIASYALLLFNQHGSISVSGASVGTEAVNRGGGIVHRSKAGAGDYSVFSLPFTERLKRFDDKIWLESANYGLGEVRPPLSVRPSESINQREYVKWLSTQTNILEGVAPRYSLAIAINLDHCTQLVTQSLISACFAQSQNRVRIWGTPETIMERIGQDLVRVGLYFWHSDPRLNDVAQPNDLPHPVRYYHDIQAFVAYVRSDFNPVWYAIVNDATFVDVDRALMRLSTYDPAAEQLLGFFVLNPLSDSYDRPDFDAGLFFGYFAAGLMIDAPVNLQCWQQNEPGTLASRLQACVLSTLSLFRINLPGLHADSRLAVIRNTYSLRYNSQLDSTTERIPWLSAFRIPITFGKMSLSDTEQLEHARHTRPKRFRKIVHQIWFGPNPIRSKYQPHAQKCREIHEARGYEYVLWDNELLYQYADLLPPSITYEDLVSNGRNVLAFSDFLRYAILDRFGGIYLDMDTVCISSPQPYVTEMIRNDFELAIGYESRKVVGEVLTNGILMSLASTNTMHLMQLHVNHYILETGPLKEIAQTVTGPIMVTNLQIHWKSWVENRWLLLPDVAFFPINYIDQKHDPSLTYSECLKYANIVGAYVIHLFNGIGTIPSHD